MGARRAFVDSDAPANITGPQDLVARPVKNEYPRDTEYAQKGYFLASVTYGPSPQKPAQDGYRAGRSPLAGSNPAARKGLIVYLKSALIRDVELTTKGIIVAATHFFHSTRQAISFSHRSSLKRTETSAKR